MRNTFIVFILGLVAGAIGLYYYNRSQHPEPAPVARTEAPPAAQAMPPPAAKPSVLDQARSTAVAAKDSLAQKLAEWHLTPEEIKADLAKTGEVVRSKTSSATESISTSVSNARIIAVINAKYTLDKELSARSIDVDCSRGKVTLSGTVASHELVAKAIGLALDTDGVTEVASTLKVTGS